MTSLVQGETWRYPLSISFYVRVIRFGASLVQSSVQNFSTNVHLAMRGLYERGILRSFLVRSW